MAARAQHKPTFFWQGVLILLPVVVMAAFGFWAILRERNTVESDARQRAQAIVQSLPSGFNGFGRLVANRLTDFDAEKGGWFTYLQWGLAGWPGDTMREQFLNNTNEVAIIKREIADFKTVFPEWTNGSPPLVDLMLTTNGEVHGLRPIPPRPPNWISILSARQYEQWTALEAADFAAEPLSNIVALATAFARSDPPEDARVCAEFIQLRAATRTQPATDAVNKLLRFAGRHFDVEFESGLPLTTLALAEALKRSHGCGPTSQLWEALRSAVVDPGALTPNLLDEAAELVTNNPGLSESISAMRILLADKQSQRELSDAIRQAGKLNGITTTNVWVDAMNRRWFCILRPETLGGGTIISNQPVHWTTSYTKATCYPESLVAREFVEALRDAKVSLPDYFGISVELEGQRIPLPPLWNLYQDGGDNEVFAERKFHMRVLGFHTSEPASGGLNPATMRYKNQVFDPMPSHPQFTVQIRLINRHLLYARQRQLQYIFGSLIGLSAVAALIGFVAALRSFRRQQQLNELKSNFVSSVSHELRAPIASVRLMAENLKGGKIREPEKQNEYFGFIVQECRRLSSLIQNVLDFSRIEQGRKQYDFEPTDVIALAQSTVKLMEPYATEKGVNLAFETLNFQEPTSLAAPERSEGGNVELEMDGRAIQQALVNLIDNAIKHSPKGETVTVGIKSRAGVSPAQRALQREQSRALGPMTRTAATAVLLSITDHGPGIPREEHQKIFERFYRRGSELRRETQGVGIGLSLVKHIVEAHGGWVTVDSEPGKGSRFTLELPVKNRTPDEHG